MSTDQEARITAIEVYHDKLLSLHEQAWYNYEVKRLEHREMQIELGQHQERSRDVSGSCSAEAAGVGQYFGRDELRARLSEHLPDTTKEPRRPMDKRFAGAETSPT